MEPINIPWGHPKYTDGQIIQSVSAILSANQLLSMATVLTRPDGSVESWINTAYFSYTPQLDLFILTPPTTQHSQNVAQNASVAIAVFDSRQALQGKRGLQLFGTCEQAQGEVLYKGYYAYAERFPNLSSVIASPAHFVGTELVSRLYHIHVKHIKIFDEPIFGEEVWVELNVPGRS